MLEIFLVCHFFEKASYCYLKQEYTIIFSFCLNFSIAYRPLSLHMMQGEGLLSNTKLGICVKLSVFLATAAQQK